LDTSLKRQRRSVLPEAPAQDIPSLALQAGVQIVCALPTPVPLAEIVPLAEVTYQAQSMAVVNDGERSRPIMSWNKMKVLLASLVIVAVGCSKAETLSPGGPETADKGRLKEVTPEVRDVVKANSDFALDLYARLAGEKPGANLFFSPYSISSALAMVAEGARGETAEQMGKVLRYPEAARRTGGDAQQVPWDMARIHAAMAQLNDHFTSGSNPPPRDVPSRLAGMRKALEAANKQAEELARTGKWQEQAREARKAQALAAEINKLQVQYSQYELLVANALWGEKTYPFQQSYLDIIQKYYRTGLFSVDFRNDFEGARKQINAWVEKQTHDRIKDMIPADALDAEAKKLLRLVLTNAIYFKGEWAEVFKPEQTKDDDFLLSDQGRARVPMMQHDYMPQASYAAFTGDGTFFDTPTQVPRDGFDPKTAYPDVRGFAMLELPYKGGEVSMVLIVPQAATGLPAVEKLLTGGGLSTWIGKLQKRRVNVFLPRFKLETKYPLADSLRAMGMVRAFHDPREANGAQFDGMSVSQDPAQKLYIGKVLHKAFVEVNEKGTEAAAATAVLMPAASAAPVTVPFTPTFKADRPFLFLIRDQKTGSILFLGRVTNPTGQG
jgi:serpin B